MKTAKLNEIVKAHVAKVGADKVNKDELAVELIKGGATFSMVNREMPKALRACGVETSAQSSSEDVKKIVEKIKATVKAAKDSKKAAYASYRVMREHAEELVKDLDVTTDRALKEIKKVLKDSKQDIPVKVKLGVVKETIVEYFINTKPENHSCDGLSKYLAKNIEDLSTSNESHEDSAKRAAAMNYTFGKLIYDHNTLDSVN